MSGWKFCNRYYVGNHNAHSPDGKYDCPGVAKECDLDTDPCQRCIDSVTRQSSQATPWCPRKVMNLRNKLEIDNLDLFYDGLPEPITKPHNHTWTYPTKDSGERQEYDSGMVRDTQQGKPRFDLVIPEGVPYDAQMLTRWAALMARGAEKYGDRNWEKGRGTEELNRAKASAFRHFMQWFCDEADEDHAAGVFFNIQQVEILKWRMIEE